MITCRILGKNNFKIDHYPPNNKGEIVYFIIGPGIVSPGTTQNKNIIKEISNKKNKIAEYFKPV